MAAGASQRDFAWGRTLLGDATVGAAGVDLMQSAPRLYSPRVHPPTAPPAGEAALASALAQVTATTLSGQPAVFFFGRT